MLFVSVLALSVSHSFDSSPKGGALGKTGNFAVLPKPLTLRKDFPRSGTDSPRPGRNVTVGDKEGNRCRAATKGGVWHRVSDDGEGEPPKGFIYACNNNTIPQ